MVRETVEHKKSIASVNPSLCDFLKKSYAEYLNLLSTKESNESSTIVKISLIIVEEASNNEIDIKTNFSLCTSILKNSLYGQKQMNFNFYLSSVNTTI